MAIAISVCLAFIIATPFTYYFTQLWLQNFAYTTQLSWWIFILAGVIALLIVISTVSCRNPFLIICGKELSLQSQIKF
ncbi:MAG: hypothetical protein K8R63_11145 [Bacteroidales bacterium]|nr:hypothetical protein [Bacteroidales bacterium]